MSNIVGDKNVFLFGFLGPNGNMVQRRLSSDLKNGDIDRCL